MKLKQLIKKLSSMKKELQDKEIRTQQMNGLTNSPEIKFVMNSDIDNPLAKTKENINYILLQ